MIIVRPAADRGVSSTNWLNSFHTFSFADYDDTQWRHFGPLRVINEDFIAPGQGFNTHAHQDMEIITYVVRGALKHQDSTGNSSIIKPGEIQRMSAGTGIQHSEINPLKDEPLHLLQIWIFPERKGLEPGYEQKQIQWTANQLTPIGSHQPTEQAVTIHQNINLYVGHFNKNRTLSYPLHHELAWLQLIKGSLRVNGYELHAGDGIALQDETTLTLHCIENAEFLLFEMQ